VPCSRLQPSRLVQDESLAFYTEVFGFEVGDDVHLGEDFRWLTVRHQRQPELSLHLITPGPPLGAELITAINHALDSGAMPGIGLTVDDCRATYEDLVAKGVSFMQEPAERPYGVEALMRDNSGNWLVLVEPREFDPSAMILDADGCPATASVD
jgi:catechol 2,3-dioxygenase-like lactoylglutathione lyase family enzyme